MRRLMIAAVLLAVLAVPALAAGHGREHRHAHLNHFGFLAGVKPAADACRTERAADEDAFKAKYANKRGRRAERRCVVRHVRQARKTCRTERQNDPAAFKAKYANEKGRRAHLRCVRQHAADPVS